MACCPKSAPHVADESSRFFPLESQYRRAALFGMLGLVLIAVVGAAVDALVLRRGLEPRAAMLAFCALAALYLSTFLGDRVRIDQAGLSRRILWWWDLWPWEAFAEGRIAPGFGRLSYEFIERPWWRRKLTLELLETSEAERVDALIKSFWRPPEATYPDTVSIRMGWPRKGRFVFSEEGAAVRTDGPTEQLPWSSVESVTVWRVERGRNDFRELTLVLPAAEIKLRRWQHEGQPAQNWTGNTPEEICAVILRNLDPARVRDFATHGAPASLAEVDARIERVDSKQRACVSGMRLCTAFWWCPLLLSLILFPWPKSCLMVAMYAPLAWAMHWMKRDVIRRFERERADLLICKAAFKAERSRMHACNS
jgi:hypothetical protein